MTYEELAALEASTRSGMTAEEISRRQQLIANVSQHNPELAAQIARGPYRTNGGSGAPPPPSGISDRARGNTAMAAPSAPPGGSASMMASPTVQANPRPQVNGVPAQGPLFPNGNYGAPPQTGKGAPLAFNPRYDFPANATGTPVSVNINLGAAPYLPPAVGGSPSAQQAERDYWGYGNTVPPSQPWTPLPASKPSDFGMNFPSLGDIFGGLMPGQEAESDYWGYGASPAAAAAPAGPGAPFGQPLNYNLGVRRPVPRTSYSSPDILNQSYQPPTGLGFTPPVPGRPTDNDIINGGSNRRY